MRIALASIHPQSLSGQIESLVGLAQSLQNRGHQVKVVSAFPTDSLLGADRIALFHQRHWSFVDHPLRVARIFRQLIRLAPQLDLIQLDLPTPAFSTTGNLLQWLVRVPVVIYFEAHLVKGLKRLDWIRQAPGFYLPRLAINNSWVTRLTGFQAAHYLVSSEYQLSELNRLGLSPERISILPNVLPADKLEVEIRPSWRQEQHLPSGRLLTYVGHYHHIKGVDSLVRAFRLLADRFPDLRLVLAWSGLGKCEEVEKILHDRALASRVVQLNKIEVPQLMRCSDVVALPYRLTIGQAVPPAVLLEAFAAGVPVVTTDLPLLREVTRGGELALLAPPDDPSGLADAIARVLNEPVLARGMVESRRAWMASRDPERIVKEYERLYEQVTTRQARVLQPVRRRPNL